MKKNLLTIGLLALSISASAQTVLTHVGSNGIFFVGENALVFNGGGLQTQGNGKLDVQGNVMIESTTSSDVVRTLDAAGTGQQSLGGNIILRLNTPATYATSTYGQLYINGISQGNITAIVDKEFRTPKHGNGNYFQQIALPFNGKVLNTLSTEFAKPFGTSRWTQNEILKYHNTDVVSDHYTDLTQATFDPTGYYMLGSRANNLDTSTPPSGMVANAPTPNGTVYTLRGVPYADGVTAILKNAGTNVNFGTNGNATNRYTERYNTYLQDSFDYGTGPWVNNYGKNLYQFGNPYFTNLDLTKIGYVEGATVGDGNAISIIQGVRYDPGTVTTLPSGSTYSTGALIQTFVTAAGSTQGVPTGDTGLMIKPMQAFVIKLTSAPATDIVRTLKFNTLRRFNSTPRNAATDYDVTANKGASGETVKQLGVIGLGSDGSEIARGYYVVYPQAVSGHPTIPTTQATNSTNNLMGSFEEDPINGGYDNNYTGSYWLYINEANEYDFKGKAIPFNLYSSEIKSLKFEVRENADLIADGSHKLSTGIGFYYKAGNGEIKEVKQNEIIPVSGSEYSLYYGKNGTVLGTDGTTKPSRTVVVYNPAITNYIVKFDPSWKKAEIKVYDMSGKLVLSKKEVNTSTDFVIELSKNTSGYVVNVISEKGEIVNTKILR